MPVPEPLRPSGSPVESRSVERFAARTAGMTASEIRALFAVASRPEVVSLAGGMPNLAALPLDTLAAYLHDCGKEDRRFQAYLAGGDPFVLVGVVLALASASALNSMALGDDVAVALGRRIGLVRLCGALAITLLTGAAVAVVGPIVFLGLVVPHVARAITGPDQRWLMPFAMVLAPVMLLVADLVGRVIARPGETEVGIVVAFLGAPFFIALVRRRRLAEL